MSLPLAHASLRQCAPKLLRRSQGMQDPRVANVGVVPLMHLQREVEVVVPDAMLGQAFPTQEALPPRK
jgi:hypothetical protein